MEQAKERSLKQLMAGVDALVETSDQLVKTAVLEHRKREKIKNMELPCLWTQDELYEKKVIFTGMRQRELLNAFREVRIRLLERSKSDNMVVLVSSVSTHGGSSFVGFNLAATFALDQHKTALYVDCNPYSSAADKYVTQEVNEGLTQYLTDYTVPLKNIIYPSGIERLRVIPSGGSSESAAEFFNSKRMEVFVAEIKSRYPDRFIVLDAPSVQQSTEARILAKYCDHALLVVPYGSAVTDEVLAAVDAVGKERFAGLVFNN
ncbi:putative polysaccharide biosynthesis protein [Cellvibrio sp. BR]|jgi:protein-tyrosine kinase|uniref:tyrosine-protein kinase family protein n=1 Tax=unclassified Cellvibrio TaxID=2624793 RepID=UPI0002601294|nr:MULTISPECIES: CpsD/CapB family tyrosine-protein kinase [unclassified Cellvibrio]EIK46699.1 putative polysaccharide biosynthesis protein [Cellvibrio sp. BR]QEY11300.1 polysaccharide biosynthesis protein [Cellvibrio sp. KY-YJ-3]UUA71407.1 CpsD/CapB family tyrosine-protein kinase [Cellvibrio sp. QJXJ]